MGEEKNKIQFFSRQNGLSLVEVVVGLFVFAVLTAGVLGAFSVLSSTTKKAREKTVVSNLAAQYMEFARNIPYSQVGTISGNPVGQLADFSNAIVQKIENVNYKIYFEVTYIDDPADGTIILGTDPASADYKQIKINILNQNTSLVTTFISNVVPKGLENTNNAGALLINVYNANGQPLSGADITITYPTTTPTLTLNRISDSSGKWIEVGLVPAAHNYRIVVTKSGYSTDQTYPVTAQNPNPVKPDATIVAGQITELSFFIDLLSVLNIRTLDNLCQPVSGVNMNVKGAKLIGITPEVYKYNQNHTSVAGLIGLNNLEWDTYTPVLLTGQSWVMQGTSPIQKIDVLPGTTQTFTMIVGANATANSLLVIVKDNGTGAALEGASVHLQKGGSVPQDYYGTTGGSVWVQPDWTGGSGQSLWSSSTPDRYFQDDGNIDINSAPTGVRLLKTSGRYALSGWLESSVFDTGTGDSNFTTISWQPTSQHPATILKFQVAAANDTSGPWSYVGPDGTASTYFTVPGSSLPSVTDSRRYFRYKAFLSTTDDKHTPVLTSVNINYVSGCATPGQVFFPDLTSGENYDIDVSLAGYQVYTADNFEVDGHQIMEILMTP